MPELGHIAYYVRDLERSVAFYQKVVGLSLVARIFKGRAAVLSGGGCHHELLLIQVTTGDSPLTGRRIGLYHTGWRVGDTLNDLRAALDRAQFHGTPVEGAADHKVIFSLYLRDPDGNEVELFVDNPSHDWRRDNTWIDAPVRPLDLSRPQPHETMPRAHLEVPLNTGDAKTAAAPSQAPVAQAAVEQPALAKNTPASVQNGPAQKEQDAEYYDESEDPDEISYWIKAPGQNPNNPISMAPVQDQQGTDEQYDESDDPDEMGYWLKTPNPLPLAPVSMNNSQGNQSSDEQYDDSEDPDEIGYWLKPAGQNPVASTVAAAPASGERFQEGAGNNEAYDELDDPDALEYWTRTSRLPIT